VSASVAGDDAGGTIEGTVTVRGETAPVQVAVSRRDDMWRGSATIKQSSFGIKPYRAFLGALRLADEVRIEIELAATVLE
jgi:polyisoprenoid-binding protein YceI